MKRVLCLIVALCLCTSVALAQPAVEAQPISGVWYAPQGADAQTATYVYDYRYPQFTPQVGTDDAINAYYASLASDTLQTVIPDTVAALDTLPTDGAPAYYTHLDYRITQNTDDYMSILLTSREFLGNAETERWTANVFACSGVYAGQQVSLTLAMGLEQEDGTQGSDISYASELAYQLVWQIISSQQATAQRDYYADLTLADLEQAFSPETDFYLDADENIVFFIQSGQVASEVEGMLTFPFSTAELLSATQPEG